LNERASVASSEVVGFLSDTSTETALEHAVRQVPIASPASTCGEVLESLRGVEFVSAADIAVLDGDRLVGLVSIERLISAEPVAPVRDIMDSDPPVVAHGIDQEVAAWKAVRHGESSLAVVDDSGRFIGLVPPRRLLSVLLLEHEEDMARLGGFMSGARSAREASQEPVPTRYWHKLPWLFVGLAGAFLSADIVGRFESNLETNVTLAFFMPGIVYLADAVGTQTETLVIRGLSVNVPVRRVMVKELVTGVLVGATLAAAFFPLAMGRWGNDVALAVSISILLACSMATVVAMALPAALQRLGRDPAFGSGPLATVIQDLLSIIIYLSISSAIVN
jgi:magnesium transporter